MMSKGRPRLLQKEGHHRHDGFDRWHPTDQGHGLRTELLHKSQDQDLEKESPATEIFTLVKELERRELGMAIIDELQKSIETILRSGKKRVTPPRRTEQESIGSEDSEETREPNTYGLP